MRRRKFIALSVGAAGSWLLAARAQQTTGTRRVAFLHPYVENDTEVLARVIAFREGLEALGWTEKRLVVHGRCGKLDGERLVGRFEFLQECRVKGRSVGIEHECYMSDTISRSMGSR